MFLLFFLALIFIYIYFGLFVLIQIIIWLSVFFVSNFLIGVNPEHRELYLIRILSILVICFVFYYNSKQIINTSYLLPLTIKNVSYLSDFKTPIVFDNNRNEDKIYLYRVDNISNFLNKLDLDDNYILTMIFYPDLINYSINIPQLVLSEPILINRNSSAAIIEKYINERINVMIDFYYLDDSILEETPFGPGVIFHYWKFYY
uniref:Uncharacterized protein n=1 Tax=Russula abietina TaxID=482377 RepID=A0A2S0U3P3_9AGAM|nr:hypothetical protein [Russula abietina]AWB36111.1 hypothetical protein [Russula abietina]